jgi:hypothetical protein
MSEIANLKELRIKYLNGNRRTKDQILTSLRLVHRDHQKSAALFPGLAGFPTWSTRENLFGAMRKVYYEIHRI